MALNDSDKKEIERISRKEIKDFMSSSNAQSIVVKMIQAELGTKKVQKDRLS